MAVYGNPDFDLCSSTYWAFTQNLQCKMPGSPGCVPLSDCPPGYDFNGPVGSGWTGCHNNASFCYGQGDRHYCYLDSGPVHFPSDNPWWQQTSPCGCSSFLGYVCTCPGCAPNCAALGYIFDPASGLCKDGEYACEDCPEGTFCDEECEVCVSDTPPQPCWEWDSSVCEWVNAADNPPCPGVLTGCVFDPETCSWVCDPPPCEKEECWDEEACECVATCAEGQCCCVLTGRCINCNTPDCADELNCVWDSTSCSWLCDDPGCAEGEAYVPSLCACRPACPEGEQWCELTEECVEATDPDCKEELNCEWDANACEWVCDDPETKCGPNREWLGEPDCRCEGSGGVWNLHTPIGHYHIADDLAGIRYRRADDTIPPFTLDTAVTADTADRSPRMIRDWNGRLVLVWVRGTDVLETVSDDEGETWQAEATMFTGATQTTIAKDRLTGLILRAALVSNEVVVTRQYPGDAAPSTEIAATVYPGGTALALDDAAFHLSHAPEGPGRWLLIGVDGGEAVNYASSDDGETWISVD